MSMEAKTNARAATLEVADDGTLTIPVNLVRILQLSPHETVTVKAQADALVLVPTPRPGLLVEASQERLTRIGNLLRSALAGIEWAEIETGRRDRWF